METRSTVYKIKKAADLKRSPVEHHRSQMWVLKLLSDRLCAIFEVGAQPLKHKSVDAER